MEPAVDEPGRNRVTREAGRFFLALSFLSRIVPGGQSGREEITGSFVWYPAAGLVLGLLAAFPFMLGLADGKPLLQGLLYTAFLVWLTRALHWDGWADLFDALGSGRNGADFQNILKDSRLGAFGAVGLVLGLSAMVLSGAACLESGRAAALVWAVVLGRCLVLPLAFTAPPAAWSSLGALACAGATGSGLFFSCLLALVSGFICIGFLHTLLACLTASCGLFYLRRTALRHGGLNGDYLGAAIIWGELSGLLTAAVF